jgi:glycosyltransferase involved in cell wall biosynthesis
MNQDFLPYRVSIQRMRPGNTGDNPPAVGRIAFVSSSSEIWGAEQSLLSLARHWGRVARAEADLYSSSSQMVALWSDLSIGTSRLLAHPGSRSLPELCRRLAKGPSYAGVVIFSLSLLPLAWLQPVRTRYVLDLHDFLPTANGQTKLRAISARVAGFVAVSQFVTHQLSFSQRHRTIVLPRTADTGIFSPTEAYSRRASHNYGVVGRLDTDKQIGLAVSAIGIAGSTSRLVVRGAPLYTSDTSIRELIRESERALGDRIAFEPPVDQKSALDGLRAVIVCRHDEPLGRTVLEAQALGVPVIVPDQGGSHELVTDSKDGLVYRAKNAASLAAAITRLEDDQEYQTIATGALETARRRPTLRDYTYTYAAGVERYLSTMDYLIGGHRDADS